MLQKELDGAFPSIPLLPFWEKKSSKKELDGNLLISDWKFQKSFDFQIFNFQIHFLKKKITNKKMTSSICDITCWVNWKPIKWSENKNYSFVNSKQDRVSKGV
jgi:hypothetical protein